MNCSMFDNSSESTINELDKSPSNQIQQQSFAQFEVYLQIQEKFNKKN